MIKCKSCGARTTARDGTELRDLRRRLCVTQLELATEVGVSTAYVSDIENLNRNLTAIRSAEFESAIRRIKKRLGGAS
jgi:transcriptional regulator with XRE-family HTH domain